MLISGHYASERDAAQAVARLLAQHFVYMPDKLKEGDSEDYWRSRSEIEAQMRGGALLDDCDGHAFAAVYALADLGIKARVLLGWTEPPQNGYHAVCETELGYVLDNRFLGQVLTWEDQPRFTKDKMSGCFEFGEEAEWHFVKRPAAPA